MEYVRYLYLKIFCSTLLRIFITGNLNKIYINQRFFSQKYAES